MQGTVYMLGLLEIVFDVASDDGALSHCVVTQQNNFGFEGGGQVGTFGGTEDGIHNNLFSGKFEVAQWHCGSSA